MNKHSSKAELWILYQCGALEVSLADLRLCEGDWVAKYNSEWHGSESNSILKSVESLAKSGLLIVPNEASGAVALTGNGQKTWELMVNPNWELAYEWKCDAAQRDCLDYSISITATNVSRLLSLICMDLNDGFYGLIDPRSIQFTTNTPFNPLAWRRFDSGFGVSFDAAVLEKTVANLAKARAIGFVCRRWYPEFDFVARKFFP